MQFVTGGIQKDDGQGQSGLGPAPRARVVFHRLADRTPEQPGQDGVFGQVTGFAETVVNHLDRRR